MNFKTIIKAFLLTVVVVSTAIGHDFLSSDYLSLWGWTASGSGGSLGRINDFQINEGEISWRALVPNSNSSASVDVRFMFAIESLENTKIHLRYSADHFLYFGIGRFQAILPAGQDVEITLDLSKWGGRWSLEEYESGKWDGNGNQFRLPPNTNIPDNSVLNLSDVSLLRFWHAVATTTVKITEFRTQPVIWSNLSFVYDGTIKAPTAFDHTGKQLEVSGGEINAGTYTASVLWEDKEFTAKYRIQKASYQTKISIADIVFPSQHRPNVSNNPENGTVVYRYANAEFFPNPKNAEFSILPSTALFPGKYWIFATIRETENFVSVNSDTISFRVVSDSSELTSIKNIQKSNNRYGIRFSENVVSEEVEISVILPNNERIVKMKTAIYDMTGNVVVSTSSATDGAFAWNLRNSAGRFVANGAYLVVVEVKNASGKIYVYSARLGVKR